MTVSAFATAVVATAITAAVASATATTFATHHFHQFLDFFVSSRTAFQYFTFENQVGTSQRVIEVNYYNIRFDLLRWHLRADRRQSSKVRCYLL